VVVYARVHLEQSLYSHPGRGSRRTLDTIPRGI
jgi:hypothetical protein